MYCALQARNSGSQARLILQGQRQAHNTAGEAGMSQTSTVQRLSKSHASASRPIPASLPACQTCCFESADLRP